MPVSADVRRASELISKNFISACGGLRGEEEVVRCAVVQN
jgi:hypothetical protein